MNNDFFHKGLHGFLFRRCLARRKPVSLNELWGGRVDKESGKTAFMNQLHGIHNPESTGPSLVSYRCRILIERRRPVGKEYEIVQQIKDTVVLIKLKNTLAKMPSSFLRPHDYFFSCKNEFDSVQHSSSSIFEIVTARINDLNNQR